MMIYSVLYSYMIHIAKVMVHIAKTAPARLLMAPLHALLMRAAAAAAAAALL